MKLIPPRHSLPKIHVELTPATSLNNILLKLFKGITLQSQTSVTSDLLGGGPPEYLFPDVLGICPV
jgi:hypothetical protein